MDRRHRVHRRRRRPHAPPLRFPHRTLTRELRGPATDRPTAAPNSVPADTQDFVPVPFGTRVPRSVYIDSIRALISAVLIEPLRTAGHEFDLEV